MHPTPFICRCGARNTHGALGFVVSIGSATHPPAELEARALAFLRGFARRTLRAMSPSAFEAHVAAAAENRMLDDKNIDEEAARYWFEIDMCAYAFGRAEAEAAAVRQVGQVELADWIEEVLLSDRARRLSIAIEPNKDGGAAADAKGDDASRANADRDADAIANRANVEDPAAFAASLPPHPRGEGALPAVHSDAGAQ